MILMSEKNKQMKSYWNKLEKFSFESNSKQKSMLIQIDKKYKICHVILLKKQWKMHLFFLRKQGQSIFPFIGPFLSHLPLIAAAYKYTELKTELQTITVSPLFTAAVKLLHLLQIKWPAPK